LVNGFFYKAGLRGGAYQKPERTTWTTQYHAKMWSLINSRHKTGWKVNDSQKVKVETKQGNLGKQNLLLRKEHFSVM
jgi:hypothetical protein